MNDLTHTLSIWWSSIPLHLQIIIIVAISFLAANQSLDFGRNLGAVLYRVLN